MFVAFHNQSPLPTMFRQIYLVYVTNKKWNHEWNSLVLLIPTLTIQLSPWWKPALSLVTNFQDSSRWKIIPENYITTGWKVTAKPLHRNWKQVYFQSSNKYLLDSFCSEKSDVHVCGRSENLTFETQTSQLF